MNALSLIQQTLLFKHFKLSVNARVNLWALGLASVAAVVMAYCGMGVWALVTQTLGLAVHCGPSFSGSFNDWRPQWVFRMASLREFFGYSSNLVVSGIINNVFNKIYPIIIGKFYGMTQTGYYTQADKYQDIASALISNIFRSVAFPVFSTVQDDLPRLNRICRKNVRAIAFFIFPHHAADDCGLLPAYPAGAQGSVAALRCPTSGCCACRVSARPLSFSFTICSIAWAIRDSISLSRLARSLISFWVSPCSIRRVL